MFSLQKKLSFLVSVIMVLAMANAIANMVTRGMPVTNVASAKATGTTIIILILAMQIIIVMALFFKFNKSLSQKKSPFSLFLIITSNKLSKYISNQCLESNRLNLDEVKTLINQSSFFAINESEMNNLLKAGDSALPDASKKIDFIIKIMGEGEATIKNHKTKMGLRDSITSSQCTLEFMQKLNVAIPEKFIRSI